VILFFLTSCGLFETRDAEDPEGKVNWNHYPITPMQTLDNLKYAWDSNENIDRYDSILSDSDNGFLFFFDSQDVQDYNLPVSWDKSMETDMRSLINEEMNFEMQLIPEKDDVIQSESALLYRDYRLAVNRESGTSLFSGSMTLYLQRESDGFWRITRWEDFRKDSDETWGRLKYEYIPQ
jgi:hypothetical protein